MRTYRLSFASALEHVPEHPERTAYRCISEEYDFRIWPSVGALGTALRMQGKRAPRMSDWRAYLGSNMEQRKHSA